MSVKTKIETVHWCTGALFDILKRLTRLTGIVDTWKPRKATAVVGNMPFCGKSYGMMFLVQEENDPGQTPSEEMGISIIGMIGTQFMAEHDWVFDFGKQEVLIPDSDVSLEELRRNTSEKNK